MVSDPVRTVYNLTHCFCENRCVFHVWLIARMKGVLFRCHTWFLLQTSGTRAAVNNGKGFTCSLMNVCPSFCRQGSFWGAKILRRGKTDENSLRRMMSAMPTSKSREQHSQAQTKKYQECCWDSWPHSKLEQAGGVQFDSCAIYETWMFLRKIITVVMQCIATHTQTSLTMAGGRNPPKKMTIPFPIVSRTKTNWMH